MPRIVLIYLQGEVKNVKLANKQNTFTFKDRKKSYLKKLFIDLTVPRLSDGYHSRCHLKQNIEIK